MDSNQENFRFLVERLITLARENLELEQQIEYLTSELQSVRRESEGWRNTVNWMKDQRR